MKSDIPASVSRTVLCKEFLPTGQSGLHASWQERLPETRRIQRRAATFVKGLTAMVLGAAATGVLLGAIRQSSMRPDIQAAPTLQPVVLERDGSPVIVYESLQDARLHAESLNLPVAPEFFLANGGLGQPAGVTTPEP